MRVCLLLGVMMSSCRRSVRAVLFLKILYLFIIFIHHHHLKNEV